MSSFKGNREYSVDSYDGKLDNIDYWNYKGKTWGHCLTYFQNRKIDNYNREYQFKNIDDYYTLLSHGIEGRSSFAMFRISDLNETGKTYLTAMKK